MAKEKLDDKARAQLAELFRKEKLSAGDTQVSEFTAGGVALDLGAGGKAEIVVDAVPKMSKSHGLHLELTISTWLCKEDSASEVCSAKLGAAESLAACASKSPIAHILETHPTFLASSIQRIPRLGEVLAAQTASREAREIAKASSSPQGQKRGNAPRM